VADVRRGGRARRGSQISGVLPTPLEASGNVPERTFVSARETPENRNERIFYG